MFGRLLLGLTRQHICKTRLLNITHLKEFGACINLKFHVPALSSLILSSAVLIDIFNSRIIVPREMRSYYPENMLISLSNFIIKAWIKGMLDLEIGLKENFHFKTLLENKCDRRNKEFPVLQYHLLKPHAESLMMDLSFHLLSKYSVWSIILVFITPQNPFIWGMFQFCRHYDQDNAFYHHIYIFFIFKKWLNLELSWGGILCWEYSHQK